MREYAIFMIDPAGHVLTWNTGAQHLKGYPPEEAIGRHFSLFYTAEDRARDHPSRVLACSSRGPLRGSGLAGSQRRLPILGERHHHSRPRRGGRSHRIRQGHPRPHRTQGGRGRPSPGPGEDLPPDEAQRFAGYIHASSTRLSEMLEGLLTYARAGTMHRAVEPIALAQLVGQVLADLTASIEQRGAEVTTTVPASATVLANAGDLRLVVQNLISNAVKFADPSIPA